MKTKLLLLSLITSVFIAQAQNRNRISAMNNEISDNLDLRVVADIFGDSRNLHEFERQLNDPELQISNLDLNNDNEVDYLRVIETVDRRTHLVIIQSILARDIYQDVATIEIEKDRNNNVYLQVVGNEYLYGSNYIYEPVYYRTPAIYTSFWSYNYRPYVSNWHWNYYPSYYYAWNPFPVYRYRNNIQISLNVFNNYNYVNYRRSNQAVRLYSSRRSNGYEAQYPNNNFSRRNSQASNRYELEQRRGNRHSSSRSELGYSQNREQSERQVASNRDNTQRENSPVRTGSSSENNSQRLGNQREYPRENTPQETTTQKSKSENRNTQSRESALQRDYTQNRTESPRDSRPQSADSQVSNSENRNIPSRENIPQRDYIQNRNSSPRESAPHRNEAPRSMSETKNPQPRENIPQRSQNQRINSQESAPQRTDSGRENPSRVSTRRS